MMKSGILVAKIGRAIETGGAAEDGATLAGQYAEAANALNARLDAVVALIDSKQVSDAVRIMEDAPRLLDEINALDFMRLPDWDVICVRRGWQRPPKLDKTHIERVILETGSMAAAESYLRMYRRAVRVNDQRLAVTSLRQLSKTDSTKDWKDNLLKAETTLQARIAEEFRKARDGGDADKALQIARDFRSEPWLEQPSGKSAMDMFAYTDAADAAERAREGAENVSLLAKMFDDDWNTDSALSLLQGIDRIVEAGWAVPSEAREVVDKCRSRCEADLAEREREAQWKACCEDLYAAVQREDAAAVRETMAAFGSLDREPEEELFRKAQLVVLHDEEKRRRKMTLVTVCVVASLAAFIGISIILFNHKKFNDECIAEAAELEALATSDNPEPLRHKLERLKREKPKVSADSRIDAYDARLDDLVTKNATRTNELVRILGDLEAKMQNEWKDASDTEVTEHLANAKALVRNHDRDYDKRLKAVSTSYKVFQSDNKAERRKNAEQFRETLLLQLEDAISSLKSQFADDAMRKKVDGINTSLGKWRDTFAEAQPDLDAEVNEADKRFAEANAIQDNLTNALARLKAASNAVEIVEARDALLKHYGDFDVVNTLLPLPYAKDDIAAMLDGSSKEMETFDGLFESGVSDEEFRDFLKDKVIRYRNNPSYYSLFGVFATCWMGGSRRDGQMIVMAKGEPKIGKVAQYKSDIRVKGDGENLFDFTPGKEGGRSESIDFKKGGNAGLGEMSIDDPVVALLEPSREIREIVDEAESLGLTQRGFVETILKKIDAHVAETRGDSYVIQESDSLRSVGQGAIPAARRVKFLKMYVGWLRDNLKAMPPMSGVDEPLRDLMRLSQTVEIEGMPNELTWACLYERRVRTRNVDCAKYLANRFPTNFTARFRQAVKVRSAMAPLSKMKVESAGKIAFDPTRKDFSVNPNDIILEIPKDIQIDHPLYVLRKDKEVLRLKKAVVPWKGGWAIASKEIKAEFLRGEPLFQISVDGKTVDFEKEVARIVGELPKDSAGDAEAYLKDVPYFGDKRRK